MANKEHLEVLRKGVRAWNEWRGQNPREGVDLSDGDFRALELMDVNLSRANLSGAVLLGANLRRVDFREANLVNANMGGANLSESILCGAMLSSANLSGADLNTTNLEGAFLYGADLRGANLRLANLSGAYLNGADLKAADLRDADFRNTVMDFTSLGHIDLTTVKGLETVKHVGPSTIGIDTIYLSKGKISEVFLRGAGVPENFVAYMKSLAGMESAFEYYSCFISYSGKDVEFAKRIHVDLEAEKVNCWIFLEDAKTGREVWEQIDIPIRRFDKVVVICSENSLQSRPVLREIERALQREDREAKDILFPVRIDDYIFEGWEHPRKADVVSKVVGDFRKWRERDEYRKGFGRLMRDLKAGK